VFYRFSLIITLFRNKRFFSHPKECNYGALPHGVKAFKVDKTLKKPERYLTGII